jgi:hypothetical protein
MNVADRAMLVALVALAIPLVIHLLYRRRARHVVFPTARFAERAHLASMGRMWLKRAVLLGLRMAVVGLLVLALAGPRLGGSALEKQPASASAVSSTSETRPPAKAVLRPIRILVVDAAGEAEVRVRSADLVVAAFAGPEATAPKQVVRCRADEAGAATPSAALPSTSLGAGGAGGAGHQALPRRCIGGIAAQQAMRPQLPYLTSLYPRGAGGLLRLKHRGFGVESLLFLRSLGALQLRQQLIHFVGIEAGQRLVQVGQGSQFLQKFAQLRQVPVAVDLVERDVERLSLVLIKVDEHHRHLSHAECLRGLEPLMPADHGVIGPPHDQRLDHPVRLY